MAEEKVAVSGALYSSSEVCFELANNRGEFQIGATVILRERRISQHPIKFSDLTFIEDQRVFQRIAIFDRKARDVVEDHIHDRSILLGLDCLSLPRASTSASSICSL